MSDVQDTQQELVEKAEQLPGVAEAAAVYARLAPIVQAIPQPVNSVGGYATGGNFNPW